eukprot:364526-Chlamydomonas_euryale.AAC.4
MRHKLLQASIQLMLKPPCLAPSHTLHARIPLTPSTPPHLAGRAPRVHAPQVAVGLAARQPPRRDARGRLSPRPPTSGHAPAGDVEERGRFGGLHGPAGLVVQGMEVWAYGVGGFSIPRPPTRPFWSPFWLVLLPAYASKYTVLHLCRAGPLAAPQLDEALHHWGFLAQQCGMTWRVFVWTVFGVARTRPPDQPANAPDFSPALSRSCASFALHTQPSNPPRPAGHGSGRRRPHALCFGRDGPVKAVAVRARRLPLDQPLPARPADETGINGGGGCGRAGCGSGSCPRHSLRGGGRRLLSQQLSTRRAGDDGFGKGGGGAGGLRGDVLGLNPQPQTSTPKPQTLKPCLLYTSDAADDTPC